VGPFFETQCTLVYSEGIPVPHHTAWKQRYMCEQFALSSCMEVSGCELNRTVEPATFRLRILRSNHYISTPNSTKTPNLFKHECHKRNKPVIPLSSSVFTPRFARNTREVRLSSAADVIILQHALEMSLYWEFPWVQWVPWESH